MSAFTDAISRFKTFFNANSYNSSTNPGGFDAGGHSVLLIPFCRDLAEVGEGVADIADTAIAAAATAITKASEAATNADTSLIAKTAAEAARDTAQLTVLPLSGECRLDYTSPTTITLSRHNGYRLIIDNISRSIPTSGVTLANTGVVASLYYVYAYWNGTNIVLEASATGFATDSRNGIKIKSGDSTRTLVGMAHTNGTGSWEDSESVRFVLSYYNRKPKICSNAAATGEVSSSNTTTPTILSESLRVSVLSWSETAHIHYSVQYKNTTAAGAYSLIYKNGSSMLVSTANAETANAYNNFATFGSLVLGPGYSYVDLYGQPNSGVGTWNLYWSKLTFSVMG